MRNIKDIKRGSDTRYIVLPGEVKVPMVIGTIYYDSKLDVSTGDYLNITDEGYSASTLPTINELKKNGTVQEESYVRGYNVHPDPSLKEMFLEMTEKEFLDKYVPDIIREFSEHGFEVSERALIHNFTCWQNDFKSGFRDKTCHIFTPCGCNDLRFSATELDRHYVSWQQTYIA